MDKLQNLNMYINQIDEVINGKRDWNKDAHRIARTIIHLYQNEIPDLKKGFHFNEEDVLYLGPGDLDLLKAKLEYYASTVEEQRYRDGLSGSNSVPPININPYFSNTSNPTYTNSPNVSSFSNANNSINITFEQTIKNITDLDLPSEEMSELIKLITEIDKARNRNDKETLFNKIGNALSFIATKGVSVWSAVFPYLDGVIKILAPLE